MWPLRITMINTIFYVILLYSLTFVIINKEKNETGNVCFCFATKLFWRWLTSSFEQKKPLYLTHARANIFFTLRIKQGKKGLFVWFLFCFVFKPIGLMPELKPTWAGWAHRSCQGAVDSYFQFLIAHLLSRKRKRHLLQPYPQQISLERKRREGSGMDGHLCHFQHHCWLFMLVPKDDSGEIF